MNGNSVEDGGIFGEYPEQAGFIHHSYNCYREMKLDSYVALHYSYT